MQMLTNYRLKCKLGCCNLHIGSDAAHKTLDLGSR